MEIGHNHFICMDTRNPTLTKYTVCAEGPRERQVQRKVPNEQGNMVAYIVSRCLCESCGDCGAVLFYHYCQQCELIPLHRATSLETFHNGRVLTGSVYCNV